MFGTTALPHVRDFAITGPMKVTGVSDTLSRRRVFSCRPTTQAEERGCAEQIVRRLATQAYRATVGAEDFSALMAFYDQGRQKGDFESGVRLAVQAILASPRFLFRMEQVPGTVRAGQTLSHRRPRPRFAAVVLPLGRDARRGTVASRLAGAAAQPGGVREAGAPDAGRQAFRGAVDAIRQPVAAAAGRRQVRPDHHFYPYWDTTLSDAMIRETQLFFDSLVRADRSLTELLTADYTFVNERLAKHYGIPNVLGSDFRRVTLTDPNRRGVLGQGSVLLLTSIADRTSPVLRGKWVMEVLLASPPPPPPPNVPALDDSVKSTVGGKMLSTRGRMEEHRKNPACSSCHRVIDPLGLALENFDATGALANQGQRRVDRRRR